MLLRQAFKQKIGTSGKIFETTSKDACDLNSLLTLTNLKKINPDRFEL